MVKPFSEEKRQKWKETILKQIQSGLSIERWCQENNIAPHIFFYWKKKLFPKEELTRSCFKELTSEKPAGITLEYQGFCIRIAHQFDSSTLKRCLELLKEIKC